mgnify:FL=1
MGPYKIPSPGFRWYSATAATLSSVLTVLLKAVKLWQKLQPIPSLIVSGKEEF